MTSINNFTDQFAFAKKVAIKAIHDGQNIVLWGSGANGKSYLMKQLNTMIENNEYAFLEEPNKGETRCINETLHYLNKDKWIMAIKNMEPFQESLRNNAFVLINMTQYKYPQYAKLRSGRT